MTSEKEKLKESFRTISIALAERLHRATIVLERDWIGGLESSGRRIVDIAGEIGELIDWQGEGYSSSTGQGYRIIRPDKPEEEVLAHHSPELSEAPK